MPQRTEAQGVGPGKRAPLGAPPSPGVEAGVGAAPPGPTHRNLDVDDPNWALTRAGKTERSSHRVVKRPPIDIDEAALQQHHDDIIAVYARRGLEAPRTLVPEDHGYPVDPDLPDDWRDQW